MRRLHPIHSSSIGLSVRFAVACVFTMTLVTSGRAVGQEGGAADDVKKILEGVGDDGPGLLPLPPAEPTSDPEAIAIVDRYLEAVGGKELLRGISDRTTKFVNTKFSATGETKAEIHLYLKSGYMYREEWIIHGFQIGNQPLAFSQIYNGDQQPAGCRCSEPCRRSKGARSASSSGTSSSTISSCTGRTTGTPST